MKCLATSLRLVVTATIAFSLSLAAQEAAVPDFSKGMPETLGARDAKIRKEQKDLDISGVSHLTYSPNREFVAGATRSRGSLVKIWVIKGKELLHQFRVPGKAHALAFTPDGSTLISADSVGNLGSVSTIRAWDLSNGKERKVGTSVGEIETFCFSLGGSRMAAVAKFSYFGCIGALKETGIACAGQIKVWRVTGEGKEVSINITHPLGEWVEMWPSIEGWEEERIEAAYRRVVPTRLRFSSDGKQLISETDAGFRMIYDSQTGRTIQHSNTSSVGLFKSMLMIALHEVPTDVTAFTLKITPSERLVNVSRRTDGWWQLGKDQKYGFKVDGEDFVSNVDGVENKEDILTMLGRKEDTNLAELVSVEHPLGVITITPKKLGLEFRLKETKGELASGETIQAGEVGWVTSSKK